MTPAPTMRMLRPSVMESRPSRPDSPAERIPAVEEQRRLSAHVSRSCDGGDDAVAVPMVMASEGAADDALLDPRLPFGEPAVRGQAGELGAGPGAAGGAVVDLAGAEDEVARARPRRPRRPEDLDVIH